MISDSSLSTAMSTTHVHVTQYLLHIVATHIDGSPTIDEELSLVQQDKRQCNSASILIILTNVPKVFFLSEFQTFS